MLEEGVLRFIQNIEHFLKLTELLPLMREAFYVAIADAENEFNVEMPKYLGIGNVHVESPAALKSEDDPEIGKGM